MKIYYLVFLLLFLLAGCAAGTPFAGTPRHRAQETVPVYAQAQDAPVAYTVLLPHHKTTPALHEPADGILLGAWLTGVAPRAFNEQAGKNHALFVYELTLGDALPFAFIIEALAAGAAPLFYLHPPADFSAELLPVNELLALAQGLAHYQVPMFVAFFPLAQALDMAADVYVAVFRLARILFRAYAPNVAFVWLPPGGEYTATPNHAHYPGHDAVDWVAVPAHTLRGRDGAAATTAVQQLATFHAHFQYHKPIMILGLGFSHFSHAHFRYYMNETVAEMGEFFALLPTFPRVRAVVYHDVDNFGALRDDLTLTREREIMTAYAQAIAEPHFLPALPPPVRTAAHWLRSAFHGYYYQGAFYLDVEMLSVELFHLHRGETILLHGRRFAPLAQLPFDYALCHRARLVRLL